MVKGEWGRREVDNRCENDYFSMKENKRKLRREYGEVLCT